MNCNRLKTFLIEVSRGQRLLQVDEARHLEDCKNCSDWLEKQRQLSRNLVALKEKSRQLNPPSRLQKQLLTQFQTRKLENEKETNKAWLWKAAAVFVLMAIGGSLLVIRQRQHPTVNKQVQRTASEASPQRERTEVTSGFIPLIHGDLAGNSVQVVRVKLPRSALFEFGLPVNVERADEMIDAEVIFGDEGLPHAIRFIENTSSSNFYQEEK